MVKKQRFFMLRKPISGLKRAV